MRKTDLKKRIALLLALILLFSQNVCAENGKGTVSDGSISAVSGTKSGSKDIGDDDVLISLQYTEHEYTGNPLTPKADVKYNGVFLGENYDYTVTYSDNTGSEKEDRIATVTVSGMGSFCGSRDLYFTIKKPAIRVSAISIDPDTVEIPLGKSYKINPVFKPEDPDNKNILYSSSNNAIATVDSDGTVTAVAVGKTVIKAESEDGGKTAYLYVSVTGTEYEEVTDYTGKKVYLIHDIEHNTYKTQNGKNVLVVLSDNSISGDKLPEYQYTSKRQKPGKKSYVAFGGRLYRYKTDYKISFRKNRKVGTAKAVIKWRKNSIPYSSGIRKSRVNFNITERIVKDKMVNIRYGRRGIKKLTVTADGHTMKVKKREYSYRYLENAVEITFSGNFSGIVTVPDKYLDNHIRQSYK